MYKKVDLVQQVVDKIEDWIRSGDYKNMDLLPSEGDISKQFEVSRATVRDAIRILEVRGYVERIHGVGIKVNNRSTEVAIHSLSEMIARNAISYHELLDVRRLIEPRAASLAAKHASDEDKAILLACVEVMEAEKSNTKKHQESDYTFHETLAKASGNRLLYTIVSSYSSLLLKQIHEADEKAISLEAKQHYHRKIYESINNNDSEGAMRHMLIHLEDTENNLKR
ncbi:FadR family transcriptional regulator [Vallitalea pronyensis]|uniref:FadR family transcriptional regulator n=1 Tax=Vallitalea pronyensis TaxID=1348613 RepID=A0A8J8SGE0_9FIRM|nr:FadR/GntR family transcriptional regulator [Vallitalea pronyensis]QUI22213.1 FadR family transcriptional regulator [Vallitalea pronyensis]